MEFVEDEVVCPMVIPMFTCCPGCGAQSLECPDEEASATLPSKAKARRRRRFGHAFRVGAACVLKGPPGLGRGGGSSGDEQVSATVEQGPLVLSALVTSASLGVDVSASTGSQLVYAAASGTSLQQASSTSSVSAAAASEGEVLDPALPCSPCFVIPSTTETAGPGGARAGEHTSGLSTEVNAFLDVSSASLGDGVSDSIGAQQVCAAALGTSLQQASSTSSASAHAEGEGDVLVSALPGSSRFVTPSTTETAGPGGARAGGHASGTMCSKSIAAPSSADLAGASPDLAADCPTCPADHPLQEKKAEGGHECVLCSSEIVMGKRFYDCRKCDFCFCTLCYKGVEATCVSDCGLSETSSGRGGINLLDAVYKAVAGLCCRRLSIGDEVELVGLVQAAWLNGMRGRLVSFELDKVRFGVELAVDGKCCSVKPANILVVTDNWACIADVVASVKPSFTGVEVWNAIENWMCLDVMECDRRKVRFICPFEPCESCEFGM
jgi:hypothetical protein